MDFTEGLLRDVAQHTCHSTTIDYQGREVDLAPAFDRLTITEAIVKYAPSYEETQLQDAEFVRSELQRLGVDTDSPTLARAGLGALQLALFEETVEEKLWNPTFIVDYPAEVSPLSRASDHDST